MNYLRSIRTTKLFFVMSVCLSLIVPTPADAASDTSYAVFIAELKSIEERLAGYSMSPRGSVLGAKTIEVHTIDELGNALRDVTGGETLLLAPGFYDDVYVQENQYPRIYVGKDYFGKRAAKLTAPVLITSKDASSKAVLSSVRFVEGEYWHVDNVIIKPDGNLSYRTEQADFGASLSGNNLKFTNNFITYGDSSGWSKAEWVKNARNGISFRGGKNNLVSGNYLQNVGFGISADFGTENSVFSYNVVDGFRGDGMRGLGDNLVFEHNLVMNAVKVDGNHDDGFQSWRNYSNNDRPVHGTTLRHNTFINATRDEEFAGSFQGIGMFDGPYVNWTIENNVVVVNHWHGISMYGGVDSVIRQNIVVDQFDWGPGPTWINAANHKDGTEPENVLVTKNIATRYIGGGERVDNRTISRADYPQYFVDPENNDWRVIESATGFAAGADMDKLPTLSAMEKNIITTYSPHEQTDTPTEIPLTEEEEEETVPQPKSSSQAADEVVVTEDQEEQTSTVRVRVRPDVVEVGQESTLTWSTEYVSSCTALYDNNRRLNPNGSETIVKTEPGEYLYAIRCTQNDTGNTVIDSEKLTVEPQRKTDSEPARESEVNETALDTVEVRTTAIVHVRDTPNGKSIGTQQANSVGLSDLTQVNAGLHQWTFVTFENGVNGYVAREYLDHNQTETGVGNVSQTNDAKIRAQIDELLKLIRLLITQLEALRAGQ